MRHPSSEPPEHVSDGYTHPAAHNNNPPWRGGRTGVPVQILSERVRLPLPGRVGQAGSVPGVRKKRSPLAMLPTPHWGGIRHRIYGIMY